MYDITSYRMNTEWGMRRGPWWGGACLCDFTERTPVQPPFCCSSLRPGTKPDSHHGDSHLGGRIPYEKWEATE